MVILDIVLMALVSVVTVNAATRYSPRPRASSGKRLTASRFVKSVVVHRRFISQVEVLS